MLRKNKIYLVVTLLLFTALVFVRHFVPKPVDWRMSFNGNVKSPYGCSVLKDMLPLLFPAREVDENLASLYIALEQDTIETRNLVIIASEFLPDEFDLEALLNYAARGNSVFISAYAFSDKLCDTLKLNVNDTARDTAQFSKPDEVLKLCLPGKPADSAFTFRKKMPVCFFSAFDTTKTVTLGSDKTGRTDFILTRFGKGNIFLHCQPLAFTNYHILYGNYRYASSALSCLPVAGTIWDQYYKTDKQIDLSPVRYILGQPSLKSAYFLLLFTIMIYMLIGSRRRQRPVRVVTAPRNTSLDFVITIGKLYYRSRNYTDLARKKIMYFNEFIRNRYNLLKPDQAGDNVHILSMKSGIEEEKIRNLMKKTGLLTSKCQVGKQELIELHRSLEDFYKNCL